MPVVKLFSDLAKSENLYVNYDKAYTGIPLFMYEKCDTGYRNAYDEKSMDYQRIKLLMTSKLIKYYLMPLRVKVSEREYYKTCRILQLFFDIYEWDYRYGQNDYEGNYQLYLDIITDCLIRVKIECIDNTKAIREKRKKQQAERRNRIYKELQVYGFGAW